MNPTPTALITGANSGIGLATAIQLAQKGFHLLLLCRTLAKSDSAADEIHAAVPNAEIDCYAAELGDFAQVRAAASQVLDDHARLDVLVNNAGFYANKIEYKEGVEYTLYASHFGHYLLTRLLMPALRNSPEARIVNVSSAVHPMGRTERMLHEVPGYTTMQSYADAKLANILFTIGLAQRLPANITTYSLHPGVVNTGFAHNTTGLMGWMVRTFGGLLTRPSKGAATSVHVASAPIEQLRAHNGAYFDKSRPARARNKDITPEKVEWLWQESEKRFPDLPTL